MVLAHAMMKQDKELDQAMKAAEEGKHHGAATSDTRHYRPPRRRGIDWNQR